MKRYYHCDLIQVPKDEGYISPYYKPSDLDEGTNNILFNSDSVDFKQADFPKIIVERSINPFRAKEIKTGFSLPMMYCGKEQMSWGTNQKMALDFLVLYTTFVRTLEIKNPDSSYDEMGFLEVESKEKVEEYLDLHPNKNAFYEEICELYKQGIYNLNAKLELEKSWRRQERQEAAKIRELINRGK